ncbi:hypothetical protein GTA08_BOTSDO03879 [Neofusicoccum parvum]|nr:hypothetical protein GTA08_BOTSDO03879 [Neofusicoccum parvum]
MDSVGKGDIQKGEDVANMNFKWNLLIFMWLEKEHAWELYKRLRSQGETLFVGDPDIILSHFLQWRGKEAEVLELGIRRLEERKTQATSSRDQNSRASFAKDALYWAVATGSLRVYKEAHLWARRFIRDPLTVPELYRSYSFEAKSLLSGSPWNLTAHNFANSDLRARIDEANEVLWDLTENLFTALREPSFNLSFWSGTLELFSDVVNDRQKQYSKSLKKVYNLSEDEIYSIIWEDTLRLLLKVEKAMLEPGHERLMMNRAHGILKTKGAKVEDALPSTYRFFDELAKARDQMWRDYRPTILSATASLPEPYPRGLPIQHLTGAFKMVVPSPEHLIPYIASRAHTVLFLDPAKALERYPEDEETQAAIGKFVDCYQTAVELQIPSIIIIAAERKRRYQEIWAHALGPLSQGRMDTTEAFRYWIQHQGSVYGYARGVPQFWPPELYSHNPLEQLERPKHDPRVPQVEDASEVVEWNPLLPSLKPIKERKLSLTYIDIAKEIDDRYVHDVFVGSPLGRVNPVIPAVPDYQLYYDTSDYSDMARDEAHIVSALLFLDTRNTATRRILSSPFPSEDHIRYPSMYLDEQFLSKGKMTVDDAFRNLELNWARVPPTLLHELTRNSLEALYGSSLSRSASIEVENIAFGLVRLLGLSDRPDLASDLAIETIIRRPDASSWHRQLLSPTFLRRLPPAQSRACITAFANTIITRVTEKAETGEEEGNKSTEKYVKVTTVKHLAQLLNEANYIDQDFAIETLRRLLHAATHPDIRASVLQSLLTDPKSAKKPGRQQNRQSSP